GVAAAVEKAVEDRGGDGFGVVGGVVGLEARGEAASQAERVAEPGDDANLGRRQDQVLVTHDLRYGGGHFGRDARGGAGDDVAGRLIAQQPLPELADGEVGDGGEGAAIVFVEDQARDIVGFIGDERLFEKSGKG